jgi:ABC-type polysaccharide/polyol phosphate export permease
MTDNLAKVDTAMRTGPEPSSPRTIRGQVAAARDFFDGILAWRLWSTLGWSDIRQRYRRSVLGPFWMTLSMTALVIVLGFVYSRIFQTEIETYLPFLALGFILWVFISTTITESCEAFRENAQLIKQIKIPYSIYVLRVVWRNFIVLLHTIIIFIPISIVFDLKPQLVMLLALPGLLLLCINLIWLGFVLAILSARFRDVPPIVATVVQLTLFASPIMWPVTAIGEHRFIADINPIYHLLELVRAPLLREEPALLSWTVGLGLALIGSLIAVSLFRRLSRQVVYWV